VDVLQKYGVGIAAGVAGRMMSQPAKPYTNERMGIYNTREFKRTLAEARNEVARQNLQGGQRWRFPAFASGSQR
jgi:hypothetical protein